LIIEGTGGASATKIEGQRWQHDQLVCDITLSGSPQARSEALVRRDRDRSPRQAGFRRQWQKQKARKQQSGDNSPHTCDSGEVSGEEQRCRAKRQFHENQIRNSELGT
jgi:hypothetical protein